MSNAKIIKAISESENVYCKFAYENILKDTDLKRSSLLTGLIEEVPDGKDKLCTISVKLAAAYCYRDLVVAFPNLAIDKYAAIPFFEDDPCPIGKYKDKKFGYIFKTDPKYFFTVMMEWANLLIDDSEIEYYAEIHMKNTKSKPKPILNEDHYCHKFFDEAWHIKPK